MFGVDTFAIGGAGLYVANAIGAPEFEIGELAIFAGYGAMYGVAPGVVLGGLVTPTSCRP